MTIDEIIKAAEEHGTHSSVLVKNLAETVKEGGGGGGVMLVRITANGSLTGITADKTLAEVKKAYEDGVPVEFVFCEGDPEADEFVSTSLYDVIILTTGNVFAVQLVFRVQAQGSIRTTTAIAWTLENGVEQFMAEEEIFTITIGLTPENTTVEEDSETGLTKITVTNAHAGSLQGSRLIITNLAVIGSSNQLIPCLAYYDHGNLKLYSAYPVTAEMLDGADLINTFE